MKVSKTGVDLVAKYEGFVDHAYQDVVGVWTIGFGHTSGVRKGQKITREDALELLQEELQDYADGMDKLVTVPLNQNQYDALTSFVYNLGVGSLKSSTLLRLLNAGSYGAAAVEFTKWNKAGGRVLAGLTRRRNEEKALFLKPIPKPAYPGLIKQGSTGVNVMTVQAKVGAVADGIFGSGTKAKVMAFQKAHKLVADGIVGKVTWNALF